MQIFFIIGGVAGWLLVSMLYGHLLPILSLPSIIAVFIGGIVGTVVGAVVTGNDKEK